MDAKLLVGFPGDKILTYAKELDNSCVVLGTHGEKDVLRNLFGSVSTKVGMDCDKPVWVIPPDAKFSEFKKIAFCTNDPLAAVSASEVLYPISNKYKSEVHLLNVFEFSDINKEEIINAWSKIIPKEKIKIKTLYDIDIVDALYKYCQENDIDLIVINRKQRSFLSMLFNKSITKKMIIKSDIPLLIMHS